MPCATRQNALSHAPASFKQPQRRINRVLNTCRNSSSVLTCRGVVRSCWLSVLLSVASPSSRCLESSFWLTGLNPDTSPWRAEASNSGVSNASQRPLFLHSSHAAFLPPPHPITPPRTPLYVALFTVLH